MSFKADLIFEGVAYVLRLMFWYLGEALLFVVTIGRRRTNWMAPFEGDQMEGPYEEIGTWVGIGFCAAVTALLTKLF